MKKHGKIIKEYRNINVDDRMKTAIMAGSKKQYDNYLRDNKLSPHECVYISCIHHLRGWIPKKLIKTGTYYKTRFYDEHWIEIRDIENRIKDRIEKSVNSLTNKGTEALSILNDAITEVELGQ